MKKLLVFSLSAVVLVTACNRHGSPDTEEQRRADEQRMAELRDAEKRAGEREDAARTAEQDLNQKRLADQQAALDEERRQLDADKAAAQQDAEKLAQWKAREEKLSERRRHLADEQRRERSLGQAEAEGGGEGIDVFYNRLEPMGDWLQTDSYGYVWQPREATSGDWRPYEDGTWVYTDRGWTWKSNEPFGWATYHYGRWTRLRGIGWVWVPGNEWAPAWVSWRTGGDYVGWAPLPPEAHLRGGFTVSVDVDFDIGPALYNFVPASRVGEPTYRGVVVPPAQNVTIVNNTTNVTKINYTTVNQTNVVYVGGPNITQINQVSARPVPQAKLQQTAKAPAANTRGGAAVLTGNVLEVPAPRIAAAAPGRPVATPAKARQTAKAEVEHGWSGGDPQAVQAAREHVREQAGHGGQASPAAATRPSTSGTPATPAAPKPITPAPRPASTATATPKPATPAPRPAATPRPEPAMPPAATPAATPRPPRPSPAPKGTPVSAPQTPPRMELEHIGTPAPATPKPRPAATPHATPPPPAAAKPATPAATPAKAATPRAKATPPGKPGASPTPAPKA